MSIPGLPNPYMASNPYLLNVLAALPSGRAAYSQDVPQMVFNFGGGPLPIVSYPQQSPFANWLGGILPGYMGLGLA
jgi:hypothetical protein